MMQRRDSEPSRKDRNEPAGVCPLFAAVSGELLRYLRSVDPTTLEPYGAQDSGAEFVRERRRGVRAGHHYSAAVRKPDQAQRRYDSANCQAIRNLRADKLHVNNQDLSVARSRVSQIDLPSDCSNGALRLSGGAR